MHEFDGGSPKNVFHAVVDGYVELLTPLRWEPDSEPGPRGPYFRAVKILPFAPTLELVEEYGGAYLGTLPACLVQFEGARADNAYPDWIEWQLSLNIHVISGHADFSHAGRLITDVSNGRTTLNEPGLTTMMAHVIEALSYQDPATQALTIRVADVDLGVDTPAWSWWRIRTTCKARQNICRERDRPAVDAVDVLQPDLPSSEPVRRRRLF